VRPQACWGPSARRSRSSTTHTSLSPSQASFWRLVIAAVPRTLLAVVATRDASPWRGWWLLFRVLANPSGECAPQLLAIDAWAGATGCGPSTSVRPTERTTFSSERTHDRARR
jgi:hypothetical protein